MNILLTSNTTNDFILNNASPEVIAALQVFGGLIIVAMIALAIYERI